MNMHNRPSILFFFFFFGPLTILYLRTDVKLPLANEDLAVALLHWLPYHFVKLVIEGVPSLLPLPSWEHNSLACRGFALIVFSWASLQICKVCCLNKVIHVLLRHVRLHVCVYIYIRKREKGKSGHSHWFVTLIHHVSHKKVQDDKLKCKSHGRWHPTSKVIWCFSP